MHRIPELDGYRAIAILAVLVYHGSYGRIAGGFLGVDLFFVLSGFLITTLLIAERSQTGGISLKAFYARRALRILPPLAAAIILAIAITGTAPSAALPAILFYANFVEPGSIGSLRHTWSLSVEEHFYVLWPVAFLLGARKRTLTLVIIASIAARIVVPLIGIDPEVRYRWTFTRADSLAVGCLLAFAPRFRSPLTSTVSAIAILACLALVSPHASAMEVIGFTAFAALCAISIASTLDGGPIAELLRHRLMQYVGTRSYGLYLYHVPIFETLDGLRVSGDLLNYALVSFAKAALTFAVAELSFRTIERYAASYRSHFRHAAVSASA